MGIEEQIIGALLKKSYNQMKVPSESRRSSKAKPREWPATMRASIVNIKEIVHKEHNGASQTRIKINPKARRKEVTKDQNGKQWNGGLKVTGQDKAERW